MLRTLLTPLRAHFDSSPRSPRISSPSVRQSNDDLQPENFARDVLVEIMRQSIENLKQAEDTQGKAMVLSEIQRIMLQDACTKDVFRELDGFLILISVLSTIQTVIEEAQFVEVLESSRLVFMILSEAMHEHPENVEHFKTRVGYDSLAQAIGPLVSDPKTANEILGFLLSLSFHDFSVSGIFTTLREVQDPAELDITVSQFDARLSSIRQPEAIMVLWDFIPQLTAEHLSMRYAIFRLLEHISQLNHRNQAVLSSLPIVKPLFELYYGSRDDPTFSERERHILQKLLRRLLDMGATPADARVIFQKAVKPDESLDSEVLEVIRAGVKARWPEHLSFESRAALILQEGNMKGLPTAGFTFMGWIFISQLPPTSYPIFSIHLPAQSKCLLKLSIQNDGKLRLQTSTNNGATVFPKSFVNKCRWTHLTLVQYPNKSLTPSIRLFIDGILSDTLNWSYPKPESSYVPGTYVIGGDAEHTRMSWCVASAYFLSTPLGDDLVRFVHHLGPRYCGNFQDPALVKFLTYEASTSLNMFLASVASNKSTQVVTSSLLKAVREGLGVNEASFVFSAHALNASQSERTINLSNSLKDRSTATRSQFKFEGDIIVVKAACLDMALWKVGGAAVALRLVQLANSPHELSRSLGILTDGLRSSWQNSEDMERLRGYEVLANILQTKSSMINMTSFETLYEFLGINFRSPEQSTIVNVVAYRAIALEFELWARTRQEIQRVHLEHFATLLQTSRFKVFNLKQRLAKMGIVHKLLFALQTDWYQHDSLPFLLECLKVAMQTNFSKDGVIKPVVSYLAANLQEEPRKVESPRSIISRIDYKNPQEKAEHVLELLVYTLAIPSYYTKFAATLPITRICLLLLGDRPTSSVATQVLNLIGHCMNVSTSFSRKFELISGWSVLKMILPSAWDSRVHDAAFNILLGCSGTENQAGRKGKTTVVCPHVIPAIFSSMHTGLDSVANNAHSSDESEGRISLAIESAMESLIEELMDLHSSSATFRQVFRSQQTTQMFITAYKSLVSKLTLPLNKIAFRILEKVTHFGLALALDNAVAGSQKREILDILQSAETILNPSAEKTLIDPSLVSDTRSVGQRLASARFSMHVGERATLKTITRMQEWRKFIQKTERQRLRKNVLDMRENRRQVSRLQEWSLLLTSERGLWPHPESRNLWRLDETEGPHRIRKKLEPQTEQAVSSRVDGDSNIRAVQTPDADSQSVIQQEVPPWAESYEISSTDIEDRQLAEEITDDKHRRVRHELEPGDVIEAVGTVARVVGVDSSPGLLIFGRTHIYMLDGLVESDDGEVIDAHEAPKRLFFVPGSILELDGPQKAQRWTHDQVVAFSDKTFLFRDVALEIYFKDSRSLLMVFLDKMRRKEMSQRLTGIISRKFSDPSVPSILSPGLLTPGLLSPGLLRTPLLGKMSAKVLSGFRGDELSTAQRKWQAREISNYTYLCILNQLSGRTPSDATQYPIFPWVLQDYTSQSLDLNSPDSYRDLKYPMGALTACRRESAQSRYDNLKSVDEKPFHYGTHFSSSMIVCHFLIRMAPFTNMFKTLQGGDWDLPDRLFIDIARAYESAAHDIRGDVRELIPEFYTFPEFLENSSNLDFGVQQNNGEKIHDVKLPPWAKQDPLLFVVLNRKALESTYVSENLSSWIDLIWGCKQGSEEALNVFHPLSYEGAIDLDNISDELEREATVGIIHNFGQTPRKLFNAPHPERYMHGSTSLPIGTLHGIEEDALLLIQGSRSFRDLGPNVPVRELVLDMIGERIISCPEGVLVCPAYPHEQIEWGSKRVGGGELRVVVDQKVVQVVEAAFCTCAAFADADNLVTGSSDYTVRLWRVVRGPPNGTAPTGNNKDSATHVTLSHIMRVHTEEVICVTTSRSWSLIVSGSKDGSAALWDLNRGVYVKSIWHGQDGEATEVHLAAINESTGYIATCSRTKLCLHTINARTIAVLDLTASSSFSNLFPSITALAFHEREYSHLGILATGGPDGTIALRTWNADGTPDGEKAQWEFVTVRTMKVRLSGRGTMRAPGVTALKFLGESLCHGEETGKAFLWTLPD